MNPVSDEVVVQCDMSSVVESDIEQVEQALQKPPREDDITGPSFRKAIMGSRVCLLICLTLSTMGVALGAFCYVQKEESKKFEEHFDQETLRILLSIGERLRHTFKALDAFATNAVYYASGTGQTWPLVTLPSFDEIAGNLQDQTRAQWVVFSPLVNENNRLSWEKYSNNATDQVSEGQQGHVDFDGSAIINDSEGLFPYFPAWQTFPVTERRPSNIWDLGIAHLDDIGKVVSSGQAVLGKYANVGNSNNSRLQDFPRKEGASDDPVLPLFYPIIQTSFPSHRQSMDIVAILAISISWRSILALPTAHEADHFLVKIENSCDQGFTFLLQGSNVTLIGKDDGHLISTRGGRTKSAFLMEMFDRAEFPGPEDVGESCPYWISFQASTEMVADHETEHLPLIFMVAIGLLFVTCFNFLIFDSLVSSRQQRTMNFALKSSAVVNELFPENVRTRILQEDDMGQDLPRSKFNPIGFLTRRTPDVERTDTSDSSETPIADFFPETTVLFADIAGFTSWSSARTPEEVFKLLEALYGTFDEIARQRGVFKVETIGDSYVAVVGLPRPRKDHAVVMARFANACRRATVRLTQDLEVELGPGTADLALRFGLNSGPVTAGVLRGDRARFQLFGDTVNTAARMEGHGIRNRIHVSQSTADALIASGRGHWVTARSEKVHAKGKGELQSYWVEPEVRDDSEAQSEALSEVIDVPDSMLDQTKQLLIRFNIEVLTKVLRRVQAARSKVYLHGPKQQVHHYDTNIGNALIEAQHSIVWSGALPTVKEIDANVPDLPSSVKKQLESFVTAMASMYRENEYHNFAHASHSVMAISKFWNQLNRPSQKTRRRLKGHVTETIDEKVVALLSDPVVEFACSLAALLKDVDHPGVENNQLVSEGSDLAVVYGNHCISQQNALDLVWKLFNESSFQDLRIAVCPSVRERIRFRSILVHAVLATDFLDSEHQENRSERWTKAYPKDGPPSSDAKMVELRASATLEILMEASELAHKMQHWQIYRLWSDKRYEESCAAYKAGRDSRNPVDSWYDDQIMFFDRYVVPLTKKIKESGIFGKDSAEHLHYALNNRQQWLEAGIKIMRDRQSREQESCLSPTFSVDAVPPL